MKKTVLFFIIVLSLVLTGCSGSKTQTNSNEDYSSEELSEVDPSLKQKGYTREQLTDPALYDYLNKQSGGVTNPGTVVLGTESDKIGKTSTFNRNRKLEISGTSQIISENKIKVSSFNYNGACGPIYLGLAITSNSQKPLAKLKEISTAQSNTTFDLQIPSNISLNQFEILGVYCYSEEFPVSTAIF